MCNGIHIPNSRSYYGDSPLKRSLMSRGYYGHTPCVSIVDKEGTFPVDLARKTVSYTFTLDDNMVSELCKYRIAHLLVKGEKDEHCIFSKHGFIPKEQSFVLNISGPVYLVGKGDSTFELIRNFSKYDVAVGFFVANKKTYAKNLNNQITGEILTNSSIITEIWANNSLISIPQTVGYMPSKNMIHIIDESKKWNDNLPLPLSIVGDNVNLIIKYVPSPIGKAENNIMYNIVQELLPNNINGGWIPFSVQDREKMYHDTYKKLKRYIDELKSQNPPQNESDIINGD